MDFLLVVHSHVPLYHRLQALLFHGLKRQDILAFILVSRVLLNARCRITEKHFTVQQMQFFGKIGGIASEEVILQLVRSKCISSLLYGLEACALTKSEFRSPSVLWAERTKKFEARYVACDRMFIHYGHCMD